MTALEQNFARRFGQTVQDWKAEEAAKERKFFTEWAILRGLGKGA